MGSTWPEIVCSLLPLKPSGSCPTASVTICKESKPRCTGFVQRDSLSSRSGRVSLTIEGGGATGALDEAEMTQRSAKELVALGPDIILTQNTPPTASMSQETRTIPV